MKHRFMNIYRLMAVLIVSAMLVGSVLCGGVFALDTATNNGQIEYTGGWNPETYPTDGTLYKDRIAVSKTIAPTEYENYFDVTLSVVAKPRVIDQSVDVVVVMDVSNTMNSTHKGLGPNDAGYDLMDARLTHAKEAVGSFLDLYSADEKLSSERNFALVTFNSYANTVIPLTSVNTVQKAEELKNIVNSITAPTENRVRFTNTEGGLQLAYNLLKESDSAFKYVIFVTDGLPTTYVESGRSSDTQITGFDTYMTGAFDESKAGTDGYFADAITGKLCTDGVNYSDKAADRADDVAKDMKEAGINIFSVGMDVDVQSVADYLSLANNTAFTTVDRTSENHIIGNTTDTYKAWLQNEIAGGFMIEKAAATEKIHRYSSGNSLSELSGAFANILNDIEIIPAETMEEAYTLDTMGDYAEFVCFYDLQGNPTDSLTNTKHGKEVAVFDEDDKSIKWWLTRTQNFYVDEIGNYVLSMSYRVRLKTEAEGFESDKALTLSEKTTFFFKTTDFETGKPLYGDNSIDYLEPQIKGYQSSLKFTKQDAQTGNPLEGAEFTLHHLGESCRICNSDAEIGDMTAESNRRGIVKFEDVPSGHEYMLIETKAPEGYKSGAHHSVVTAYGKAYLDSEEITDDTSAAVKNYTIEPVVVQLTAQSGLIGRDIAEGEFHFSLTGVFEFGNKFHEIESCDEKGFVTFHEMRFDQEGTYNFKLVEVRGRDTSVIYDTKEYNIQIVVGLSEDGHSYTVETEVDGEAVENDTSPAPFEFTNKLREASKAQLEVENTLDSEVSEDGVFRFNLWDENGNVIETASTENGKAVFAPIEYNREGVYRYTITEDHYEGMFDEIFFDHSVYEAVVTVTAVEGSAAFETCVEYFLEGEKVEVPVFRNITREAATLKLNFVKTLDDKAPAKDSFAFVLKNSQGEVLQKVNNTEGGAVPLSVMTFDKVGYYTYTITEVKGEDEGINYDNTVYTLYVTVEPHHNVSNYFIEVDLKKSTPEGEEAVVHAHGINIDISAEKGLFFVNSTKEPETPTEPETTLPAPVTDATSATETPSSQSGADTPDTGASNAAFWFALILVAGAGAGITVKLRRKEKDFG